MMKAAPSLAFAMASICSLFDRKRTMQSASRCRFRPRYVLLALLTLAVCAHGAAATDFVPQITIVDTLNGRDTAVAVSVFGSSGMGVSAVQHAVPNVSLMHRIQLMRSELS